VTTTNLAFALDELVTIMDSGGYKYSGMYKVHEGGMPEDGMPTRYKQLVFTFNAK